METQIKKDRIEQLNIGDVGIITEDLSFTFINNKTLSSNIVINSSTPVDLTNPIMNNATVVQRNPLFYYDAANNLIRASDSTTNLYSLVIEILLSGTLTSGGSGDIFSITLHRPNDVIFRSFLYDSELTTETFTSKLIALIPTHVFPGGNDNFQLPPLSPPGIQGGFRIKIARVNGNATLTLTTLNAQSIRIFKS